MADERQKQSSRASIDGGVYAQDFHVAGRRRHLCSVDLEWKDGHHLEKTGSAIAPAQGRSQSTDFPSSASASQEAAPTAARSQTKARQEQ